eukprot:6707003-Prymnesium_polylepis.1
MALTLALPSSNFRGSAANFADTSLRAEANDSSLAWARPLPATSQGLHRGIPRDIQRHARCGQLLYDAPPHLLAAHQL